jgi:hypothetical protein
MKGRFGRLAVVLALVLAAIVAFGVLTRAPRGTGNFGYITMEGAAKSAGRDAADHYGVYWPQPEAEARCPARITARSGQLFWCQVPIEGQLVGVEMQLISPRGFYRLVKVAENSSIWDQLGAQEESETQRRAEEEAEFEREGECRLVHPLHRC